MDYGDLIDCLNVKYHDRFQIHKRFIVGIRTTKKCDVCVTSGIVIFMISSDTTRTTYVEEKTEVIYGAENIIKYALDTLSILKESVDNCAASTGPSMFVIPNHPITKAYRELKERGIRLRFITEITKDNIRYRKELMKICELRHLDEVKGNFGISDGLYYRTSV